MKIISLAPSNTEILFALGAGEQIIARTAYCDYPPQALSIPKVGDWVNPNIREIKKLKPDLVITSTIVQAKLAENLKAAGLPVQHFDVRRLKDIFDSIQKIGELAGKSEEAKYLANSMLFQFGEISKKANARRPRIYIEEWHKPPFVSGNWIPELANIAGGEYEMAQTGELSKEFANSELRKFDPEMIILSICGIRCDASMIYNRKEWKKISAVRRKQVHVFDDSLLNRPGPRLVSGCRKLAEAIGNYLKKEVK